MRFARLKIKVKKHMPLIMTVGSIAGLTVTTYLAAKNGQKIKETIEDFDEDTSKKEAIKELFPVVAPVFASYTLTAGCMIGSYIFGDKNCKAAMATAVATKTMFDKYRKVVAEAEEKLTDEQAMDKVVSDIIDEKAKDEHLEDIKNMSTILFYEPVTGTYFNGNQYTVQDIERAINKGIWLDGCASMFDVFNAIPSIKAPEGLFDLGWNCEDLFSGYMGDGWVRVETELKTDKIQGPYYHIWYEFFPWEGWFDEMNRGLSFKEYIANVGEDYLKGLS